MQDPNKDLLELFPDAQIVEYKTTSKRFATHFLTSIMTAASLLVGVIAIPVLASSFYINSMVENLSTSKIITSLIAISPMQKSNIFAVNDKGEPVLLGSVFQQNRTLATYDEIPKIVQDAAVASEDTQFWNHSGINVASTVRAFIVNETTKSVAQGASTITQQYVKNLLIQKAESLPTEEQRLAGYEAATGQSYNRKINEAILSFGLEKALSKEEILTGYLNIIGFGGRTYGIKEASMYYYGKEMKDLTLDEAATLIGIVNVPELYRIDIETADNNKANGFKLTLERRNYVLSQMFLQNNITKAEYDDAKAKPIVPNITNPSTGCETAKESAYFCDYVTRVIQNDPAFGKTPEERANLLYRGGLQIYTTLDWNIQSAAIKTMKENVPSKMDSLNIGAAVSTVENSTGRVLAMVQNTKYTNVHVEDKSYTAVNYNTDYNYGGSSGFQTGSTYKLFTLVEWLKAGHGIYETFPVQDYFTKMNNSCMKNSQWEGGYTMHNDNKESYTSLNANTSTISSLNTGFLSMAQQLDLCGIAKTADAMGGHRADGRDLLTDPSTIIGTNEIAPLSMVTAYATVGNNGIRCDSIVIDKITDIRGKPLASPKSKCKTVIPASVAHSVSYIMKNVVSYGTAGQSRVGDGIDLAGKTGTTDNAADTWIIGYTTKTTTGVWVGNTLGKKSMYSYSMNGNYGPYVRHYLFKDVQAAANKVYGGDKFPAPPKKALQ